MACGSNTQEDHTRIYDLHNTGHSQTRYLLHFCAFEVPTPFIAVSYIKLLDVDVQNRKLMYSHVAV